MKYIGMDAHSRNCFFIVLTKSGKEFCRQQVSTTETNILEFIRSIDGSKKLVYEEGVMSQWFYLLLKDEVDELVVCQPSASKGAKTDWIDAAELADLLRVSRLKSVFHSDDMLMNLRVTISGYKDLNQEIVRTKNRYKALYREAGLATDGNNFYNDPKMLSQLETEERKSVASFLFEQIALLETHYSEYSKQLLKNVSNYKPIKLLTGIPGIGPVRANQAVAVMVTPYRFTRKYNLFAYTGLTRHSRQSDGKLYGRRRFKGQPVLKEVFKGAALQALAGNNSFSRKYDDLIANGTSDKSARNAVTKMMAATVLGVWKSGKRYDDKHMEVTRKQNQNSRNG